MKCDPEDIDCQCARIHVADAMCLESCADNEQVNLTRTRISVYCSVVQATSIDPQPVRFSGDSDFQHRDNFDDDDYGASYRHLGDDFSDYEKYRSKMPGKSIGRYHDIEYDSLGHYELKDDENDSDRLDEPDHSHGDISDSKEGDVRSYPWHRADSKEDDVHYSPWHRAGSKEEDMHYSPWHGADSKEEDVRSHPWHRADRINHGRHQLPGRMKYYGSLEEEAEDDEEERELYPSTNFGHYSSRSPAHQGHSNLYQAPDAINSIGPIDSDSTDSYSTDSVDSNDSVESEEYEEDDSDDSSRRQKLKDKVKEGLGTRLLDRIGLQLIQNTTDVEAFQHLQVAVAAAPSQTSQSGEAVQAAQAAHSAVTSKAPSPSPSPRPLYSIPQDEYTEEEARLRAIEDRKNREVSLKLKELRSQKYKDAQREVMAMEEEKHKRPNPQSNLETSTKTSSQSSSQPTLSQPSSSAVDNSGSCLKRIPKILYVSLGLIMLQL